MNDAQRSVERIHQLSDMLQSLMQQAAVLQQKPMCPWPSRTRRRRR